MFCAKCGAEIAPGVKFCGVCGTTADDSQAAVAAPPAFEQTPPPAYGQAPQTPPPAYGQAPQALPPQYGAAPPQYGAAPPAYGQASYAKPTHVPSLILGIIALVAVWFTLGIAGVVCGIIAVLLARKNKNEYKTTAGFVLGLIGFIIGIIMVLVMIVFGALLGASLGGLGGLGALSGYY